MKFEKVYIPFEKNSSLLNLGSKTKIDVSRSNITDFGYYLKVNSAYYANESEKFLNKARDVRRNDRW